MLVKVYISNNRFRLYPPMPFGIYRTTTPIHFINHTRTWKKPLGSRFRYLYHKRFYPGYQSFITDKQGSLMQQP